MHVGKSYITVDAFLGIAIGALDLTLSLKSHPKGQTNYLQAFHQICRTLLHDKENKI